MLVDDAQLARAVGDTQYTPATDKGDTRRGVRDSTDKTHVGFRVLLAMDHCNVGLRCTPGNHTVRLIAATVDEKKSIDETTVRDQDGTRAQGEVHVVSNSIRENMRVQHKEGNVPEGEDPL